MSTEQLIAQPQPTKKKNFHFFTACIGEDKLFTSLSALIVFVSYMSLFIAQGILITASRGGSKEYSYNVTTVVLLTELAKLVAAAALFFTSGSSIQDFLDCWVTHTVMILYYLVPSALYAVYNNLSFLSLAKFDPTTYFLLLQLRVVVTGVIFQWLFSKQLSRRQWLSLLILTAGCILKECKKFTVKKDDSGQSPVENDWALGMIFIMLQVFASCFAGVYNEYLLKGKGAQINLWFQNCCMYIDSIVCNIFLLICRGTITSAFTPVALSQVLNVKVISIIINNAAIGIVTALFLKKLNSILKTFASALELMFTAVLCWLIFAIPIDVFTIAAIVVVSVALAIYSLNPVVNKEITRETVSNGV